MVKVRALASAGRGLNHHITEPSLRSLTGPSSGQRKGGKGGGRCRFHGRSRSTGFCRKRAEPSHHCTIPWELNWPQQWTKKRREERGGGVDSMVEVGALASAGRGLNHQITAPSPVS